jgi:hypothetical protein
MDGLRESVNWVVCEWPAFEPGDEWRGWGRKQKEKTRERRGCRGGRQAQIIDMFASRDDQSTAWAFVSAGLLVLFFHSVGLCVDMDMGWSRCWLVLTGEILFADHDA